MKFTFLFTFLFTSVHSFTIMFKNNCNFSINIYNNHNFCFLPPNLIGCDSSYSNFNWHNMFRNGYDPQATLVEFALTDKIWYDISIIPPGCINQYSLLDCQNQTNNTGFNTPVQIKPLSNLNSIGFRCKTRTCLKNGCSHAYNFPTDDSKVFSCPIDTDFLITYCPSPFLNNKCIFKH